LIAEALISARRVGNDPWTKGNPWLFNIVV